MTRGGHRIWFALSMASLMLAAPLMGCGENKAALPSEPADGKQPKGTLALPSRKEGDSAVFGPFSSWVRGIDWFWCRDGRKLLVTAEQEGAGQLWVIDVATGQSKLLRDVPGVEAIFPVGWSGPEEVVCLELPGQRDQQTTVSATDVSGYKGTRVLGRFSGRLLRHAITRDGKFLTVHFSTVEGGKIWRLDTCSGSAVDLLTGLPIWDGLYPVWFSPDGLFAAMPEPKEGDRRQRLRLLDIVSGQAEAASPYLELVGEVVWSPGGSRLAYKVADGRHKVMDTECLSDVLSPKVRVLNPAGEVEGEYLVPGGQLVRDIAWLDDETLVLGTAEGAEDRGPAWVARLGGSLRPASPELARALEDRTPTPYPMPKGSSESYRVEIRRWQDRGNPPTEELVIIPVW